MLKALILRSRIDAKKKELEALNGKDEDFQARETELRAAFDEVDETTSEEDRATVEAQMEQFDADQAAHEEAKKNLQSEIDGLEADLQEVEARQNTAPKDNPEEKRGAEPQNKGKVDVTMFRTRALNRMSAEERSAFFEKDEVKGFISHVRALALGQPVETRSITGSALLIPEVVLPLIREEAAKYSKLMKHVNVRPVPGTARQIVEGSIPEGVWTEACANLNELNLAFTQVEVDGYKVGGFIPVCNAVLEDSDIALADELFSALGQGIGYAVDKAIVYGTGTKMPTGFAATATKKNVSGNTDTALFRSFIRATGDLKHERGDLFWVCNHKTKMALVAASLSINAAGAIVAGVEAKMPVIGGTIEELDFVPDDEVLGGYGANYLLAERAGTSLGMSEHVRFTQDQTVFKGTARYDGKPVFNDAFIAIGLGSTDATGAIDANHGFASDTANT